MSERCLGSPSIGGCVRSSCRGLKSQTFRLVFFMHTLAKLRRVGVLGGKAYKMISYSLSPPAIHKPPNLSGSIPLDPLLLFHFLIRILDRLIS